MISKRSYSWKPVCKAFGADGADGAGGHAPITLLAAVLTLSLAAMVAFSLTIGQVQKAHAFGDDSSTQPDLLAAQTDSPDFYAVLHADGELVFQTAPSNAESDVSFAGTLEGYDSAHTAPWLTNASKITSARFADDFSNKAPLSLACWFADCSNMTAVDLTNLDASKSTTMEKMFQGCSALTTIKGLSSFYTSSSTYFGSMFKDCASLIELDLSHFNSSQVEVICFMFNGCTNLKMLDLSGWNTSKIRLSVYVFDGCKSLERVTLGKEFSFCGSRGSRAFRLPDGNWKSLSSGIVYAGNAIPNNAADTYVRITESGDKTGDGAGDAGSGGSDGMSDVGEVDADHQSDANDTSVQGKAKPTVKGIAVGKTAEVGGITYKVTSNKQAAVSLVKAPKSKSSVTIPATVKIKGKRYAVSGIAKGAFNGAKVKTLIVKTKRLTKQRVKGCFKGAKKLKVVKVPKAKKTAYTKIFKKANSGKFVTVR